MKTKVIGLLLSLVSIQALAGSIPDGQYKGQALWKSSSARGTYQAETTVSQTSISSHYTLPDGSTKDWNFEIVPQGSGFFTVKSSGAEIGSGYCLENADVCHYEIRVGALSLEETLTSMNNKLYRFGSKDNGHGRIMWQEALDKQ